MDSFEFKKIIEHYKTLRVLYVEDEPEVRNQTLKMMKLCFDTIFDAQDGLEGLDIFKREKIDIIFTDINMPRMDGLSMIKAIRVLSPKVPIIVFSAYDYPDYFLTSIQHDVAGYLLKPFQLSEIIALIQKLSEQNRLDMHKQLPKKDSLNFIEGFYWDIQTQSLCQNKREIALSKKEIALFELLICSKQRTFSSEEIEIAVFDDDFSDNKRVRNLLSRLRQKLGVDLIQTIYGQGYKLKWQH